MRDVDWEILYELYQNPNMTKVADKLYVSQPSLSKRIQYMEEEFQVQIVERTPKGLVFTEAGALLGERAKQYLTFYAETKRMVSRLKTDENRTIVIGSSYTFSKFRLTEILIEYQKQHPEVQFEVINAQSNILFKKAVEGQVDVAFVRGDYEGKVSQTQIGESQAYLVSKCPVAVEDLHQLTRIYYQTNERTTEILDRWWSDHFDVPPIEGMHVGFIDFAWQIIDKGIGYTICFLPENFENAYGLSLQPLKYTDGNDVIRKTWFVYREPELTKQQRDFADYIVSHCKNNCENPPQTVADSSET